MTSPTPPRVEVMLNTFGTTTRQVIAAAQQAEERGIEGVWIMDHVSGTVHDRTHVFDCWTMLGALAGATTRCRLGTLVTNASLRTPALVAHSAATLQELSGGRFWLGVGAGGGAPDSDYALELAAAGATNDTASGRRMNAERFVREVQGFWTGTSPLLPQVAGFLQPEPIPPIVVGGYGKKMAALAGQLGSGFNTSAEVPDLEALATTARQHAKDPETFEVSAFALYDQKWIDPAGQDSQRLAAAGVDTLILVVAEPWHELRDLGGNER